MSLDVWSRPSHKRIEPSLPALGEDGGQWSTRVVVDGSWPPPATRRRPGSRPTVVVILLGTRAPHGRNGAPLPSPDPRCRAKRETKSGGVPEGPRSPQEGPRTRFSAPVPLFAPMGAGIFSLQTVYRKPLSNPKKTNKTKTKTWGPPIKTFRVGLSDLS